MEKTTTWFKWYPSRWRSNDWVQTLSLEERGYYHELLNWQMEQGSVSGEPKKQASYVGASLEQAERLWAVVSSRFKKKTRYWSSNSFSPDDGQWVNMTAEELLECHKDGDRYINEICEQVRASGHTRHNKAVEHGHRGAAAKAATAEIVKAAESQENPFAKDVAQLIGKHYPKRRDRVGFEEGLQAAVDNIDTEELLQRFEAALRAYRQSTAGTESKYIRRLDKFMAEWTGFVPDGFKPRLTLVPPVPTEPGAAPVRQKRALSPGTKPPWEPRRDATEEQKQRLKDAWSPERQERWWYNEPLDGSVDQKAPSKESN